MCKKNYKDLDWDQTAHVAPGNQRSEFSRTSCSNFMPKPTLAMQYVQVRVFHMMPSNHQRNLGQSPTQTIFKFCIFGRIYGIQCRGNIASTL